MATPEPRPGPTQRGQRRLPLRQVSGRRRGQPGPQRLRPGPGRGPVRVMPLARQQRGAVPGKVIAEQAAHVLDEPAQRPPRAVDQRHHPLPRPRPAGALAVTDVQLPEPAQLPPHVRQVQAPGLVHPQPHLGHQPGRRVVPGRRGELPARRQLLPPPGEQPLDLARVRRDPQRRPLPAPRPVHLIDRALGHIAGQLINRRLVTQLHEQEVRLQRLRPRQPGARRRGPQHLPEILIRVRGTHLPQRPAEPLPGLLQVRHVQADRPVRQPCRRPRQHEPGQHVRLERRQLLRARGDTHLPHVPDNSQPHPDPRSAPSLPPQEDHAER